MAPYYSKKATVRVTGKVKKYMYCQKQKASTINIMKCCRGNVQYSLHHSKNTSKIMWLP